MLEQKQSQNDFGRRAQPAARPAFRAPFGEGLTGCQQLIIVQHLVGGPHPVLPQVGDFLGNQSFGEAELGAAGLDQRDALLASARRIGAQQT